MRLELELELELNAGCKSNPTEPDRAVVAELVKFVVGGLQLSTRDLQGRPIFCTDARTWNRCPERLDFASNLPVGSLNALQNCGIGASRDRPHGQAS